jgi:hypothetical protein
MVLPGHLSAGYLITRGVLAQTGALFSPTQIVILYVIGILAGDLPDTDLIWFNWVHFWRKKWNPDYQKDTLNSHRDYASHAPLLWLAITGLIMVCGYFTSSPFTEYTGLLIFLGTWSHFGLDSIEHGIMWLWPFSHKRFAMHKTIEGKSDFNHGVVSYYWTWISKEYFKDWTAYAEVALTVFALWVLISSLH